MAASHDYNFDHPGAFDFELLVATLRKLKLGKSVKIPVYDFTTHKRQKDWVSRLVYSRNTFCRLNEVLSFKKKKREVS